MAQDINVMLADVQEINVNIVEQKIYVDIQGAIVYSTGSTQTSNLILTNLESISINTGELVFGNTLSTGCLKASSLISPAIGFNLNIVTASSQATIVTLNGAYLVQSNWTTLTGSTLLTPNTQYYLSQTAGKLTVTPDQSTALFVQPIGTALTTTIFKYDIQEPIWL